MKRHAVISGAFALLLALPATAHAQSLDRSIERLVERVSGIAERIASRVERQATALAWKMEREFRDGRFDSWSWDDEWSDREHRHEDRYENRREDRYEDRREGRRADRSRADWGTVSARLDTTIAFAADGTVDLSNVDGEIIVTGWDRREARIVAESERGELEYDLSSSRITIEAHASRRGYGERHAGETRYELSVPRGVRVIAHSTAGDITTTGTNGEVEANTLNGDVAVSGAARRIEISTVSGDIVAKTLKGDVIINSVNGTIELDDVDGGVRMESTSGDLTLTNARSREIDASTTSGEIVFDGDIDNGGRYEFHSHSGNIQITVPSSASAKFSVETYNGELDSDFPITIQPSQRATRRMRRIEFNVGAGDSRVIAETFSGNLDIRKR